MKKILLALGFILITSNLYAGLIDISTLSNDSQVSYTSINTANSTIKNCINGNIESANIKDATITVDDMASTASPAQREGDHFNPYTKTGMLPATSTDLTSDISAGTSYVESDAGLLYRIVTDATSKTYTAAKDTWVYIDTNGAFQYVAQTVGAAQPETPANSLLLAKVVTDADNITGVTDYRTTTISFGASEDFYRKGMNLLYYTTGILSVDTGTVRVGSSTVTKSTVTALNVTTAGDYINGASEAGANKTIYIYVNADGDIKLDDSAPDYHDTSGNTAGVLHYYYNTSDTTYYRNIGLVTLSGDNTIIKGNLASIYRGEKIVQVVRYDNTSVATGVNTIPEDDSIPQITEGDEYMTLKVVPTYDKSILKVDVVFYGDTDGNTVPLAAALFRDTNTNALKTGAITVTSGDVGLQPIIFTHILSADTTSVTTFRVRAGSSSGATTFNGNTDARLYGGTCASSIVITEMSQ